MPRRSATDYIRLSARSTLQHCDAPALAIAFSGGPDSMALLHSLAIAAASMRRGVSGTPRLMALHCNFHLRGEESERDRRFAEKICQELNERFQSQRSADENLVQLLVKDFDTIAYCSEKRLSVEAGARELRHGWFKEICDREHALLATGHNADDNAETMLLNMLRGSGARGLRGMLPRDRHIVRPLLRIHRRDILTYLEEENVSFVTDSTNLSTDYRRNFLRHDVLPLLRSRWAGADTAIASTLSCLADDSAVVEKAIADSLAEGTDVFLPWNAVKGFAAPRLLILRFIAPYGGTRDIAEEIASHIEHPRYGARWKIPESKIKAIRLQAAPEVPLDGKVYKVPEIKISKKGIHINLEY